MVKIIDELLSHFNLEKYPIFDENIVLHGKSYTPNDDIYGILVGKLHSVEYARVKQQKSATIIDGKFSINLSKGNYDIFEGIVFNNPQPTRVVLSIKNSEIDKVDQISTLSTVMYPTFLTRDIPNVYITFYFDNNTPLDIEYSIVVGTISSKVSWDEREHSTPWWTSKSKLESVQYLLPVDDVLVYQSRFWKKNMSVTNGSYFKEIL